MTWGSTVVHAKGGLVTDLVMMLIVISSFLGPTSAPVEMNGRRGLACQGWM